MSLDLVPLPVFQCITAFVDSRSFYCMLAGLNKRYRAAVQDPLIHKSQGKTRLCFTELAWTWFTMNSFDIPSDCHAKFQLSVVGLLSTKTWWKECSNLYRYQRMVTRTMTRHCPNRTLYGQSIQYELPQIFKSLLVDRLTVNLICPIAMNHSDPINRFHLLQPNRLPITENCSQINRPRPYTVESGAGLDSDCGHDDTCDWFQADEFVWFAGKGSRHALGNDFSSWALFIGNQLHDTIDSSVMHSQYKSDMADEPVVVDLNECPIIRLNNHPCFGSHLALNALNSRAWLLAGALCDRLSACEIDRLERWTCDERQAATVSYHLSRTVASEADRVVLSEDLEQSKLLHIPESAALLDEHRHWNDNRVTISTVIGARDQTQQHVQDDKQWNTVLDHLHSYQHNFLLLTR